MLFLWAYTRPTKYFMTNKLWVFGDSFAELGADYAWQVQTAKRLQLDLYNVARNGVSNEWITRMWSENYKLISPNDYLVVIVSFMERLYIFPDNPEITIPSNISTDPCWNNRKKERQAFEMYWQYLHTPALQYQRCAAWLHWVDKIAARLRVKPIIINAFEQEFPTELDSCTLAQGHLQTVSREEWHNINDWFELTSSSGWQDRRLAHMTESNHNVLSNKIVEYFTRSTPLDLTTEFLQGIYSK